MEPAESNREGDEQSAAHAGSLPASAGGAGHPPEPEAGPHAPEAEALLLQRQLFDCLAAASTDCAVYALDLEGVIVSWNSGAARLTGFAGAEVAGEHFSMFFPDEDHRRGRPGWELKEALERGQVEYSGNSLRKDGSLFYATISTAVLRSATGAILGFTRVVRDVTRFSGAEAGLHVFLEIWDQLPIGLLIIRLETGDGKGKFAVLAADAAMLNVIRQPGLTLDDLPGKTLAEVLPDLIDQEVSLALSAVLRTRQAQTVGQLRCRGAPDRLFSIEAFPLPDGCVGLTFEDITERKRLEEELRASEAASRRFLEAVPDALVVVDSEGRIARTNRATELLFGYRREELEQRPIEVLVPELLRQLHTDERMSYWATPQTRYMGRLGKVLGRRKDGSEFPAEVRLSPLRTENRFFVCCSIREKRRDQA
jgi:PAS domain S-box-containing protein